ncbi:MAG TPA: ABC transporter permease [Chitinophaga sp.]|uniref:ABC transporter permease n=1 Tax=Chitinophaga sp. TaxID=1869181 RepID=UPI002BF04A85|nr:ABC transporter permease [Chitinophaga sp.]HVI45815.1 ABC transporter permease [Chitinophaga sp.]
MFSNYLLIAWRNLVRYRYYSLINIAGLSVGLAACWLLLLYVQRESSYDNFYPHANRIYRAVNHATWSGGNLKLASTSAPFAAVLKQDYPEIEAIARIQPEGGAALIYNGRKLQVDNMYFADSTFFHVFGLSVLAGDTATALSDPHGLVLTRSLAAKLTGANATEAVGKAVQMEDRKTYTITAVMEDLPANSHFAFSALRAMPPGYNANGWQEFDVYTYMLLRKGVEASALESKLPAFFERYLKPRMGAVNYKMSLQPLQDIHLYSNLDYEISPNGNIVYIRIFLFTGFLILLIACINYMNLATARASGRVREVGVRKTLGSGRTEIARMFMAESLLLSCFSALVAFLLVWLALPYFSSFTGGKYQIWQFGMGRTLCAMTLLALFAGFLAGIYPAVFMSGFKVVSSLKGRLGINTHAGFRKALVTFQFVVAMVLAASAIVAYNQMKYVMQKNLGFDKNLVLSFHLHSDEARRKAPALKEQLLRNPLIAHVAAASNPIGKNDIGGHGFFFEKEGRIAEESYVAQNYMVDADYLRTMGITLQRGRNFSDTGVADRHYAVLVNETLVKALGWKEPLGKRVQFKTDQEGTRTERVVVGVIRDFHTYSLQHKITPLVLEMAPFPQFEDNMYVKLRKADIPAAIAYIEKTYHAFDPEHGFDYNFVDENFSRQYSAEQKQEVIFMLFTILTLFIACLGLFGLAAFMAVRRTKEIGVRKTLGASTGNIVQMLSKDFMQLVAMAAVLAFPLSWWMMYKWLDHFAYHINISVWVFVWTGAGVAALALLTVSYHAIKAALANPAKSLYAE